MGWNRSLSLAAYLAGAALIWSAHGARFAGLFLATQAVTLILIWFADFFGDWIGAPPIPSGLGARTIDRESPPGLVAAFGWIILAGVFAVTYFWV